MRSLFRILSKELIALGVLFFVIVPFVMSMTDDYAGRQHVAVLKQAGTNVTGAFKSGGGKSYVSGGPIHMPRS